MLDELNQAITDYQGKWQRFVGGRLEREFFQALRPTAVGWKAVDLTDFDQRFAELRLLCDQIHVAWINERWIATMHVKGQPFEWDISTVKLMQRRPGSADATGLDHLDFLLSPDTDAKTILAAETDVKWSEETNGANAQCQWLSIWFVGTEAKLRTDTVLGVCIKELQEVDDHIRKGLNV